MKKLKDIAERDGYPSVSRLLNQLIFSQRTSLTNVFEYCDQFKRQNAGLDEEAVDERVGDDLMELLRETGRMARYIEEWDSGFEE